MAASNPHYQAIRRAIVQPNFGEEPEEQLSVLTTAYSQLAQEVVTCHNRVLVDQIAVPGAAAGIIVLLPAPFPDTDYSPIVSLDWAAFGWISAIAADQFTVTFSAAAPGGGGILRTIIIR